MKDPATYHAVEQICQWIISSKFTSGSRLPSGRKIERTLGLSHSAVTRALLQLIERGVVSRKGYRLFAGDLNMRRIDRVEVVSFLPAMTRAAKDAARLLDVRLTVHDVAPDFKPAPLRKLLQRSTLPLLWTVDQQADLLRQAQRPVVTVSFAVKGFDSVMTKSCGVGELACEHLFNLGHERVGMVYADEPRSAKPIDLLMAKGMEDRVKLAFEFRMPLPLQPMRNDEFNSIFERVSKNKVSALVAGTAEIATLLVEGFRRNGVQVPQGLSVLCLSDVDDMLRNSEIDSVRDDWESIFSFAMSALIRRGSPQLTPRPQLLRIDVPPVLFVRGSVTGRAVRSASVELGSTKLPPISSAPRRWPIDANTRRLAVMEFQSKRHDYVDAVTSFHMVSLSEYANRPLANPNGLFGEHGLYHLPHRETRYNGVPFNIVSEPDNDHRGVVVMSSQRTDLPHQLDVPVKQDRTFRVIYLLHTCGFAARGGTVATITAWFEGQRVVFLPMKAPGLKGQVRRAGPVLAEPVADLFIESNHHHLQDWWPSFPVLRGKQVLPVLIAKDNDPDAYERYLYSLEVLLPRQGRIDRITIEMNKQTPASYALLAITLGE